MENIISQNKCKLDDRSTIRKSLNMPASFVVPEMPQRARSIVGGNGHFPYARELERFLTPPSKEKHPSCLRGTIALLEDEITHEYDVQFDQTLYFPDDVMRRNIAVFGQIGSGKTQRVMIPLMESEIRDPEKSLVVLGTKGDEYDVLCYLAEKLRPGARIECLNLADAARSTLGWNPLASSGVANRAGAARDNAQIWIESAGTAGKYETPFFRQGATRLIAGMILAVERVFGTARPVDVFELLESAEARKALLTSAQKNSMPFLTDVGSFMDSINTNVQTIVAEAQNACQYLIDADVAAVTSQDDFKFDDLFNEPTILVLEVPQDTIVKTSPFVNMFFTQLFDAIARRARRARNRELPRPLSIYMDDFAASANHIPDCSQRLNMMRSMNARVILALQSSPQLERCYSPGEAEAIIAACNTKIYIPPVSLVDANAASSSSGSCTVVLCDREHELNAKPRRRVGFERHDARESDSPSWSGDPTTSRALLTPSDVLYSPKNSAREQAVTVFLPGYYPFQAWLPYASQLKTTKKAFKEAQERVRTPNGVKLGVCSRVDQLADAFSHDCNSEITIERDIEKLREQVGYTTTAGAAKTWWDCFERENAGRKEVVRMLLQELVKRNAKITEFFLAFIRSNTDNIQGVLHYFDYDRVKREEDRKKRKSKKTTDDAS